VNWPLGLGLNKRLGGGDGGDGGLDFFGSMASLEGYVSEYMGGTSLASMPNNAITPLMASFTTPRGAGGAAAAASAQESFTSAGTRSDAAAGQHWGLADRAPSASAKVAREQRERASSDANGSSVLSGPLARSRHKFLTLLLRMGTAGQLEGLFVGLRVRMGIASGALVEGSDVFGSAVLGLARGAGDQASVHRARARAAGSGRGARARKGRPASAVLSFHALGQHMNDCVTSRALASTPPPGQRGFTARPATPLCPGCAQPSQTRRMAGRCCWTRRRLT
jgi:hypothetical protein